MEEVQDKKIRLACLQHALDSYLSDSIDAKEWEECDDDEAKDLLNEASVWQPFEDHPYDFLIDQIEKDATSVERLIRSFL